MLTQSRRIAQEAKQRFESVLSRSLESGNILRSFSVCRHESLEILSDMSRAMGVRIARVSLRPRNPSIASPDAWEQRVLQEFEWRNRAGEHASVLEHGEFVDQPAGRVYRYMVAVPVDRRCMRCHGPDHALTDAVREKLTVDYPVGGPHEGYRLDGFAGAISITRSW